MNCGFDDWGGGNGVIQQTCLPSGDSITASYVFQFLKLIVGIFIRLACESPELET